MKNLKWLLIKAKCLANQLNDFNKSLIGLVNSSTGFRRFMMCAGIMISLNMLSYAQKIEIKGKIVEEVDGSVNPVGYVNVTLLDMDSIHIAGTSTDDTGHFHLKNVEKGNYLLTTSYIGYVGRFIELENLSKSVDLGNITISLSSINLDELTVTAKHYVSQIDRKIIFPDENQIKKSTDGMDLLNNLQLSGIDINRLDNSIAGARGGKAEVRINGQQVQQKEILAIDPKDIIRIEYHDNPSLRYGDNEVVIDYIVRRKETGGSVMVYGQKGLPADKADAFSVAKLNYKKSEFSILGGINYRDFDGNYRTNHEIFNYQDGNTYNRIENGLTGRSKNDIRSYQVGYSFIDPDKHQLAINIGLNTYEQVNDSRSILYQTENNIDPLQMHESSYYKGINPYVNMYYQLKLKNKQLLVFDLIGYYHDSDNNRNYGEASAGNVITDLTSHVDGSRYWVTGEAFYEKSWDAGRLNIGVRHTQTRQENEYTGDILSTIDMNQSTTYFYAEWMGRINKLTYSGGVGGTQVHINQEGIKSDEMLFTPTLRLGYQFNNHFRLNYTGRIGVNSPSIGDMNAVEQAIDALQIRRGNPYLKPADNFHNLLTISYDKKTFSANIQILDQYTRKPIMESVFEEDEMFVHIMENQTGWHQVTTTGFAKVSLLDGNLNMNVRGGLNWVKSWGERYNHNMRNWFLNGGINYTWKKWNPFWNISTRRNSLTGETISYSEQSTYFGLRYKFRNLSASAYFKHILGWNTGKDNMNRFASGNIRTYSPDSKNMFLVDFVWNFSFGRKFNGQQKKINNSDGDAGIMKINR